MEVFTMKKYLSDERDRFFDNRLGLFVHRGIYSVGEWNEQHGYRAEYTRFMTEFNPTDYNPSEWLVLAEKAGYRTLYKLRKTLLTTEGSVKGISGYLKETGMNMRTKTLYLRCLPKLVSQ